MKKINLTSNRLLSSRLSSFFSFPHLVYRSLSLPTHPLTYLRTTPYYLFFSISPDRCVARANKGNSQRTRKHNLVALLLSHFIILIFPSSRLGWLACFHSTLLRLGCSLDLPFIGALWPNRYLIFLRLIGIITA